MRTLKNGRLKTHLIGTMRRWMPKAFRHKLTWNCVTGDPTTTRPRGQQCLSPGGMLSMPWLPRLPHSPLRCSQRELRLTQPLLLRRLRPRMLPTIPPTLPRRIPPPKQAATPVGRLPLLRPRRMRSATPVTTARPVVHRRSRPIAATTRRRGCLVQNLRAPLDRPRIPPHRRQARTMRFVPRKPPFGTPSAAVGSAWPIRSPLPTKRSKVG